jgi:hypothetical protein
MKFIFQSATNDPRLSKTIRRATTFVDAIVALSAAKGGNVRIEDNVTSSTMNSSPVKFVITQTLRSQIPLEHDFLHYLLTSKPFYSAIHVDQCQTGTLAMIVQNIVSAQGRSLVGSDELDESTASFKLWFVAASLDHRTVNMILKAGYQSSRSSHITEEQFYIQQVTSLISLVEGGQMLLMMQWPGQVVYVPGGRPHAVITCVNGATNYSQTCLLVGTFVLNDLRLSVAKTMRERYPCPDDGDGLTHKVREKPGTEDMAILLRFHTQAEIDAAIADVVAARDSHTHARKPKKSSQRMIQLNAGKCSKKVCAENQP